MGSVRGLLEIEYVLDLAHMLAGHEGLLDIALELEELVEGDWGWEVLFGLS
jgi:hypothetical protein